MAKKLVSVAALWLALAALVFIYTDRDEYTWRYEEDTLSQILIGSEEADRSEQHAQDAMAKEQQAAQARTEAGLWGTGTYDVEPFLPAQGENGGLNLSWGDYDVTVQYDSPVDMELRAVSAGRQTFIQDGAWRLSAGAGTSVCRFTLTDSTSGLFIAGDPAEGAEIRSITVHKVGAGIFSADLAAYAALLGAVLTVLLVLSWDTSARGRMRRRDALMVLGAAAFSCMPLLWGGVFDGHDMLFHLNRIEGIASGLRCGQFPVRIHASTLLGYGYAASEFYPELFLYIPAILRNMGVSLCASVRVFEAGINLLAALSCYVSAKAIFGSRRTAVGASVLYTLCVYRLVNLYTRATLGESLAMIFFPLIIWSLYEVLRRDDGKWPLLALGMTGVCMSHLLSTLFSALFCAIAAAFSLPKLVREKRRFLAILKAAAITALCCVWFYVPMMQYSGDGVSTSVVLDAQENVLQPGGFFVAFAGDMNADIPEDFAYTIGVVPGLALLVGCVLLLVRRYAQGKAAMDGKDRAALALCALGAVALIGATDAFPWELVCSLRRPFSTFFKQIQFPWRLVGVAVPMMSMAAAWGYLKDDRHASAGAAVIVALCAACSGYTMQCMVQRTPVLDKETFTDTRISQFEYTYVGTEKTALKPGDIRVGGAEGAYSVLEMTKHGTNLTAVIEMEGGAYIELPLLYYPGYQATVNGIPCKVARGTNNMLRVYGTASGQTATVDISFKPPMAWIAAQGISLLGLLLLLLSLRRMKRA